MTKIKLNGKDYEINTDTTVSILLDELQVQMTGTAVAVNSEIVSRDNFNLCMIKDGDSVDIIRAIGGG